MPSEHFADEAAAIADLLRPAILKLNRDLRRETREAVGLSPFQTLILGTVAQEPGIGVNELAARERIKPPSMSAHVKQLEAAGLLRKIDGLHDDRRRVGLAITDEGQRVILEVRRLRTEWLAARITKLTEQERRNILQAVEPLIKLSELSSS